MRSLLTGIMIGAMPFLVSCGAENVSETKVIIGENDLSFYSVDDEITNSIGKMALGCTATHLDHHAARLSPPQPPRIVFSCSSAPPRSRFPKPQLAASSCSAKA